ncbi:MAG: MFS transporter [Pseudonocardiales bacterium]
MTRLRTASGAASQSQLALPPSFWLLFAGTLLNRLGILVPAFLALYLSVEVHASPGMIGVLVGVWGAGSVTGSFVGGVLADCIGARGTIIGSQAAAVLACLALLAVRRPEELAGAVFLSGCVSTLHKPAGAVVISRALPTSEHVRAFGLLYWASNIGAAISPAVSGLLLEWSPHWLIILNVMTALSYAAVALWLPPSAAQDEKPKSEGGSKTLRRLADPFRSAATARFLLLSFCLAVIYLQKQSTLPLDMAAHGLPPHQYGLVISLNGLLIICVQPVVFRLTKRIGIDTQFVLAALLVAGGFGANALASGPWTYTFALTVWTLGEILLVPQASAFLIRHAPEGQVGAYQGAYYVVWNLGLVLGAPVGMAVLQVWGSRALWSGCLALGLAVVVVHMFASRGVLTGGNHNDV